MELNFDAKDVPPNTGFDAIPAGTYACTVIGCEWSEHENAGAGLKITLEIDDNKHPDIGRRQVFDRLWINDPRKPRKKGGRPTREIARAQLSAICHAADRMTLKNPDDLIGANVAARLTARDDPQYGPQNDVQSYLPLDKATGPLPERSAPGKSRFEKKDDNPKNEEDNEKEGKVPAGRRKWGNN